MVLVTEDGLRSRLLFLPSGSPVSYTHLINEALFGEVDEKVKSLPLFGISKKIYKGEIFPPESDDFVSDDNLFNYQAKIIKEVAAEDVYKRQA